MAVKKNPDKVHKPHKRCAGEDGENAENSPEKIFSGNAVNHAADRVENFYNGDKQ